MYRLLILLFTMTCLGLSAAQAQDLLIKTDGEEVLVKELKITSTEVSYKRADDPDGPLIQVRRAEVFLVRYANGTKEVLPNPAVEAQPALSEAEAYQQGQLDARKYYKAPGAFWGTFGATLVTAPLYNLGGVVTGAVVATSPPNPANMFVPDQRLLQNTSYVEGYRKQAQRRKLGSAAGGFGAALGTQIVLGTIIILVLLKDGFS